MAFPKSRLRAELEKKTPKGPFWPEDIEAELAHVTRHTGRITQALFAMEAEGLVRLTSKGWVSSSHPGFADEAEYANRAARA